MIAHNKGASHPSYGFAALSKGMLINSEHKRGGGPIPPIVFVALSKGMLLIANKNRGGVPSRL